MPTPGTPLGQLLVVVLKSRITNTPEPKTNATVLSHDLFKNILYALWQSGADGRETESGRIE